MSYLVVNPEDRFSRNEAHFILNFHVAFIPRQNATAAKFLTKHFAYPLKN